MLTGARCRACDHALPLKARLGDFSPPPASVACPGCGQACPTNLPYRVGWMEALAHKALVIASVPGAVIAAAVSGEDLPVALGIAVAGPVVGGVLVGFVLSKLLGLPLTLLRDTLGRA